MIKSMTGYGRGESTLYNRRFIVEIKSVNHRYNDISIKIPRVLNASEEKVKNILIKKIQRGKTDVYINFESFSKDDVKINFNAALSDAYYEQLTELKERYEIHDSISLSLLSRFPDVITVEKFSENEEAVNEMNEALEAALRMALDQFIQMRVREGESLKKDILEKAKFIQAISEKINEKSPELIREYSEKLKAKVSEALGDYAYDEARLITEVTLLADKTCVDEELTRLKSHVNQLLMILEEDDSVGRKLDFLIQEMNREVNTIGSKSNDLDISRYCVELKSEIEKIREQVQNIE